MELNTEIYEHDNDVDVTHKINTIELDNWINHLKYIGKEVNNLVSMCTINDKLEDESVFQRLQKKKAENETLLNALLNYSNSRIDIAECEDMNCDMTFIKEHEAYRKSYLYHLDKYRRLKDEFFDKVQGSFTLISSKS
ncbi:hypothetical protein [uncultured Marixanthomonas sp.]|uniref:hypothetical protein n=1 Tax=uncultured Marixanthomonas sp. TaxID=757245 RepID=UPI0030DB518A|tara:strand:- start:54568 stop:54981 length:414 start_codon:yes stop_codon:yes gene_type:complete